ncbi:MAG: rod shape-determining protein RodA [Magnetospiraceae bacterium]
MPIGQSENRDLTLTQKLLYVNWMFILLLATVVAIGAGMLFSAANADMDPWATRHFTRFGAGLALLIGVALVHISIWIRFAYVFYALALVLLIAVEVMGQVGMGAQRWIDLGVIQLQPSEIMKFALVLALARYFHYGSLEDTWRLRFLVPPVLMVALAAGLVLKQPDLGTALMMVAAAAVLFFLAGVRARWFALAIGAAMAAVPIGWQFLHGYQKDRVLTFLDPSRDPLGAGYHITQSKIALGSGGMMGKGFLNGSQSHLNYLPEKHTDFIFTMLSEEFGLMGGLILLSLYVLIIAYGYLVALRTRSQFGRLVALGVTTIFFLYVFINIAMVMGLLPVVGVPLPLVSYGGTAMLSLMAGFGLVICVSIHREAALNRHEND